MKNKSRGMKVFTVANYAFMALISIIMFLPFWVIISVAFSSERSITEFGYTLWPKEFSLDAFRFVLEKGTIFKAYGVSLFVTIIGTILAVVVTSMVAYAISRKNLKYRNAISMIVYFTMLFNGGLVPWYITVSKYGMKDNIWGLILPIVFTPWNMFLIRNFFKALPDELVESAKLDGAGELKIFFRIILPLSLPGVATITLFYMLNYWNDWWLALNLINDETLYPLQYLLRQVLSNVSYASSGMSQVGVVLNVPTETVKMATCLITIGPIILVYPFIQKYFIKGITVGAVKG